MIQAGLCVIALGLLYGGIAPLAGWEKGKTKTHPGVAVAMIVLAIGLIAFAFLGVPHLL